MKSTANRLFLIVGAFILALMVVDGLLRMHRSALPLYGAGPGAWVEANSAAALFLVGLVLGVTLGIALFFASLVWRERRIREEDEKYNFAALFEEIESLDDDAPDAPDAPDGSAEWGSRLFSDEAPPEDFAETKDPWEKPADWWKSGDDD